MKKMYLILFLFSIMGIFIFSQCSKQEIDQKTAQKMYYGGFENQIKWGEHLVTIMGCNDCHTPKKMTPNGPEPDMTQMLAGHPSNLPDPDVNRKETESKGLATTNDLTVWVGPWGVSYAANLTPDPTGIGNWTEANFFTALRDGKYKGLAASRPLMPPMPWEFFKNMSDDEIKAMFTYLKSIKPIQNTVPDYKPPLQMTSK